MSSLGKLILFNVLIALAIWLGAWLSLMTRNLMGHIRIATGFSAGIFLGVSFLHLIPESVEILGDEAGLFILGGFVFFYLLERIVMTHPCEENQCNYHSLGVAALLGLSLHSLTNGLALGSSMYVPALGFTIFLATLMHKAPESFSLTTLLCLAERPKYKVFQYVAILSLMVPLGTAFGYFGVAPFGERGAGMALAASSGLFLQIATGDLLPEVHSRKEQRGWVIVFFILGVVVAYATRILSHTS